MGAMLICDGAVLERRPPWVAQYVPSISGSHGCCCDACAILSLSVGGRATAPSPQQAIKTAVTTVTVRSRLSTVQILPIVHVC